MQLPSKKRAKAPKDDNGSFYKKALFALYMIRQQRRLGKYNLLFGVARFKKSTKRRLMFEEWLKRLTRVTKKCGNFVDFCINLAGFY